MRAGLSRRMLVGLALGAMAGLLARAASAPGDEGPGGSGPLAVGIDLFARFVAEPAGKLFLRALFVLVLPLIVSSLALGVAGLGDLRRLGRIGARTFAYTLVVSSIAVFIGVGLVNAFRPGGDSALRARLASLGPAAEPAAPRAGIDFFVELVPSNPVKAMAEGDMLAVMVVSLLLGIGLATTRTEGARRLEGLLQGVNDVAMTLLHGVIGIAPYAVFCLVFTIAARHGAELIGSLGSFVLVVVAGLALQLLVVYSISVSWLGGMSPLRFFGAVRPAMLTAFSTASSNATLPTALLVADEGLRLPRHVSRFVLTLGATANQNGTALFEGTTVLFLAQIYGVHLALAEQLFVVAICILGGIGTAGVPGGSLPVVALILGQVGIPAEGIGLILGVDRFLDMCRTTVNVTGDLAAAVVVSRGEPSETRDLTR